MVTTSPAFLITKGSPMILIAEKKKNPEQSQDHTCFPGTSLWRPAVVGRQAGRSCPAPSGPHMVFRCRNQRLRDHWPQAGEFGCLVPLGVSYHWVGRVSCWGLKKVRVSGVPFSVGLHSKVTQTGAFTHWATFPSEAPALKGSTFPNNVKS